MPFSGTIARKLSAKRSLAGSVGSLSGTLTRKLSAKRTLAGTLGTLTGTVSKKIPKAVAGVLSAWSGSLSRMVTARRTLAGSLGALAGTMDRRLSLHRSMSGSLGALSGTISKKMWVSVAGTLGSLTGSLGYQVLGALIQSIEGVLSFAGTVTRKLTAHRSVAGDLAASGTIARKLSAKRSLAGTLSFGGGAITISRYFQQAVAGILGALSGAVSYFYSAKTGSTVRAGGYKVFVIDLCRAVAASGEGATFEPDSQFKINFGAPGIAQAKLSGTATVAIEGRLNENFDWISLAEFTATGVNTNVKIYPQMRYNVTAYTDGTIYLSLGVMLMSFHHKGNY